MPQSQKRRADGGRNEIIIMPDGYSMRYHAVLRNGEERWKCSRGTLGEDVAGEMRHCQGSARKFPWEGALRLHTVHSPWCRPKQNDEQMRTFNDELHRLAAADETLPASTAVDMVKHGKSIDFLKRLPKDDSLVEKVNRRRNQGPLFYFNDVGFGECEVPPSFQRTLSDDPFLILDYQGDGRLLVFSSPTQIRMLSEADEWGLDGTFCKPADVMQRFVVVALVPRTPDSPEKVPMTAAVAYMQRRRVQQLHRGAQ